MKKGFIIFIIVVLALGVGNTQTIVVTDNQKLYNAFDRLLIKFRPNTKIHSSIKPYSVSDIVRTSIEILESDREISSRDIEDIEYILKDNIDWLMYIYGKDKYDEISKKIAASHTGFLKYLYKSSSSFYAGHHKDFFIKVDPVINFRFGKDIKSNSYIFNNTRGFRISGLLDKKIYFYSSLYETQQGFLTHINRKIKRDLAIPGQAFYKPYKSSIFKGAQGYDFLNAQAYIGFSITKNLLMQLGHGKVYLGDGVRSLLLSDYSTNYYYLKFDTRIWKFHYQNVFAELSETSRERISIDTILPKKYMAAHYLSFKLHKNFEISLFESVIFSRNKGNGNRFELQYLNPIILYRTVEQFTGSGDNVLVGLNWKYNIFKGGSFYGQLLLDEFNFSKIKEDPTWWGNKYGFQIGFKYFDILKINHLDLQVESNIVRPYTYAHRDSILSYSHYNQALAHPLGANFKELIIELKYSPITKLMIRTKALFAAKGEDYNKFSYGGNILRSNDNRPKDVDGNIREFGYRISDGKLRKIAQFSLNFSYMLYHNYFLDFDTMYRKDSFEESNSNFKEFSFSFGIRANIDNKCIDY